MYVQEVQKETKKMSKVTLKKGVVEIYYDEDWFTDNDHEFDYTVTISEDDAYWNVVDAVIDEQKMTCDEAKAYIKGLTDCGYDIYDGYEQAIIEANSEEADEEYESFCREHEEEWHKEAERERQQLLDDYYRNCL